MQLQHVAQLTPAVNHLVGGSSPHQMLFAVPLRDIGFPPGWRAAAPLPATASLRAASRFGHMVACSSGSSFDSEMEEIKGEKAKKKKKKSGRRMQRDVLEKNPGSFNYCCVYLLIMYLLLVLLLRALIY